MCILLLAAGIAMRVHVPLLLVKSPEVKMAAMALLALLLHNVKSEEVPIGM